MISHFTQSICLSHYFIFTEGIFGIAFIVLPWCGCGEDGRRQWSPHIGGADNGEIISGGLPLPRWLGKFSCDPTGVLIKGVWLPSDDGAWQYMPLSILFRSQWELLGELSTRCWDSCHPPPLAGVNFIIVFNGMAMEVQFSTGVFLK